MYAHTWNNDSPAMREKKRTPYRWRSSPTEGEKHRSPVEDTRPRACGEEQHWHCEGLRHWWGLHKGGEEESAGWRHPMAGTCENPWTSERIFQVKIHNSWKSPRVQWKTVSAEGWKSLLKHTFSQLIYLSICWVASKNQHRLHLGCSLCGCSWRTPREM